MTAAEAVLAGRPVITSTVVPAHEILAPACLLATPNDPASYAHAVLTLLSDAGLYERLRTSCEQLQEQFYDRAMGLTAVLERTFASLEKS